MKASGKKGFGEGSGNGIANNSDLPTIRDIIVCELRGSDAGNQHERKTRDY